MRVFRSNIWLADKPRIPPTHSYIRMQDRADGTVWVLIHNTDEGRVGISDAALSARQLDDSHFYGPYEGPCQRKGNSGLRWFIRGGRLGYEELASDADTESPPAHTRQAFARFSFRLLVPTTWSRFGQELGYEGVQI